MSLEATQHAGLPRHPRAIAQDIQPSQRQYISPDSLTLRQCLAEVSAVFCFGQIGTLSYYVLTTDGGWFPNVVFLVLPNLFVAILTGAFALMGRTYRSVFTSAATYRWAGAVAVMKATSVLTIALFIFKISDTLSRGAIGFQFGMSLFGVLLIRALLWRWINQGIATRHLSTERVVILGDISSREDVLQTLKRRGSTIVEVVAFGEDPGAAGRHVVDICRTKSIDRVILRTQPSDIANASRLVGALAETPATVEIVPFAVDMVFPHVGQRSGESQPTTVILRNRTLGDFDLVLKRAFDIAVASTALVMLAPVLAVTAVAIRMETNGPVLFRQARHGYGNRTINVYKFRSMKVVESGAAARQATKNDPRITKVGAFIRRTNIDELPQLLNVIAGDMSIVGPRPHPLALNDAFSDQIRLFNRRHNIKPGITGWAQVNGLRGETDTIDKMQRRVEHDIWYVANWSFLLDLRIVFLTVMSPRAYKNAR